MRSRITVPRKWTSRRNPSSNLSSIRQSFIAGTKGTAYSAFITSPFHICSRLMTGVSPRGLTSKEEEIVYILSLSLHHHGLGGGTHKAVILDVRQDGTGGKTLRKRLRRS